MHLNRIGVNHVCKQLIKGNYANKFGSFIGNALKSTKLVSFPQNEAGVYANSSLRGLSHVNNVLNRVDHAKWSGRKFIHTLRYQADQELLAELSKHLPGPSHPEYYLRQSWIVHLATHKLTVQSDFVAQLGHVVHLIDIRSAEEISGPVGYIPGINWFPKEDMHKILNVFPRDSLIAIVCSKDSDSREVVRFLKANGHPFAAVMAGGMRTWKLMGFASTRDPNILNRRCQSVSALTKALQAPEIFLSEDVSNISLQQVIDHIGTGDKIQWLKMAAFMVHGRLSCVDGRDDCGVIGTPGGDMGEFIIGLTVLEDLLNRHVTEAEAAILFQRRLDAFGRFYMHTDQVCMNRLMDAIFQDEYLASRLKRPMNDFEKSALLGNIPIDCRGRIMKLLLEPAHIGCGHLRLLMTESERYKVRKELVILSLKCYFYSAWEGAAGCDYVVLSGHHDERGVTNVMLQDDVHSFSYIPLIPPSIQGKQVFVNHSQISTYLRHELASWFMSQTDIVDLSKVACAAFGPNMDLLADLHVQNTLSELAKSLPMYSIKFDNSGNCTVEYNGVVGNSTQIVTPAIAAAEAIENISKILNSIHDEDDDDEVISNTASSKVPHNADDYFNFSEPHSMADSIGAYYGRGFAHPTRVSNPTVIVNGISAEVKEVEREDLPAVKNLSHPNVAIKSVPVRIESPTHAGSIPTIAELRAMVQRHRNKQKRTTTCDHEHDQHNHSHNHNHNHQDNHNLHNAHKHNDHHNYHNKHRK